MPTSLVPAGHPATHLSARSPVIKVVKGAHLPGATTLHAASHGLPAPVVVGLVSVVVLCVVSGAVAYVRRIRRHTPSSLSRTRRVLGRARGGMALVAIVALAAGYVTTGASNIQLTSADASGPGWSAAQRFDKINHQTYNVSCPTSTFCMATTIYGHVWTYNGSSWTAQNYVHAGGGGPVACGSASFCVEANRGGGILTWSLSGPTSRSGWSTPHSLTYATGSYLTADLTGVSCPTASFCVAVGPKAAWTYTSGKWSSATTINPQTSAADWMDLISSVSCSSSSFCVAVTYGGYEITYNGSAWTSQQIDAGNGLTGVACMNSTYCVAVNNDGSAYIYNGSSWSAGTSVDGTNWLAGVSCVSTGFCPTVDRAGGVAFVEGSTGQVYSSSVAKYPFTSVSCAPGSTLCIAVDNQGQTYDLAVTYTRTVNGVSCPTGTSFCMAVGTDGNGNGTANTSTDGGKGWSPTHVVVKAPVPWSTGAALSGVNDSNGVSCPKGTSFCMAVGTDGNGNGTANTSTDGGESWGSTQTVSGVANLASASCPSASFCTAVGGDAAVTWNGSSWAAPHTISGTTLNAVSCASSSFCVAVGTSALKGIATAWNGTSWSTPTTFTTTYSSSGSSLALSGVSCPSTSDCVAVGANYNSTSGNDHPAIVDTTDGGSTWSGFQTVTGYAPGSFSLTAVSCPSTSFCMAGGSDGNGSGVAPTSTTPFGSSPAWSIPAVYGLPISSINALSCANASDCVATGANGNLRSLTMTTNGGAGWTGEVPVAGTSNLYAASCASTTECVAVGTNGTNGVTTYSTQPFIFFGPYQFNAVSCTSSTFCMAVGGGTNYNDAAVAMYSTDGGVHWHAPAAVMATGSTYSPTTLTSVSCASSSFCVAVGTSLTKGIATTWNGTSWSTPTTFTTTYSSSGSSLALSGVSCPSTSDCVAVGANYNANTGDSYAAIVDTTDGGSTWSGFQTIANPGLGFPLGAVSCASTSFCAVAGTSSNGGTSGYFSADASASANPFASSPAWTTPARYETTDGSTVALSCVNANDCVAGDTSVSMTTDGAVAWLGGTNVNNVSQFNAVSCASTTECVAVGTNGTNGVTTYSTQPFIFFGPYQFNAVSCTSSTFCMAVGGGTNYNDAAVAMYSTDGGVHWHAPAAVMAPGTASLNAVSCASSSFCEAVGTSLTKGIATTWNGTSWSTPTTFTTTYSSSGSSLALSGVSCPSTSDCVAVGTNTNGATSNPHHVIVDTTDGGSTWSGFQTIANPDPSSPLYLSLTVVSCPSTSFCMAGGSDGNTGDGAVATSASPFGSSPAWSVANARMILANPPNSLSCANASDCVAVACADYSGGCGQTGGVITMTTDGGSDWSSEIQISDTTDSSAVSCASTTECVAAVSRYYNGNDDAVITYSTDPFSSSPSWTPGIPLIASIAIPAGHLFEAAVYNGLVGSSCVADGSGTRFCAIADGSGNLITGTLKPTGSGGTWVFTQSAIQDMHAGSFGAVSCASPTFCVAVDNQGNADTWNGSTWTLKNLVAAPGVVFTAISCPTSGSCVATDAAGRVWTDTSGTWTHQQISSHPLRFLACPTSSFCMAVSQYPTSSGFAAASYTDSGGTWSSATTLPTSTGIDGLSCPSATSCVAVGGVQGTEMTWTSGTWSKPSADVAMGRLPGSNEGFQGVACTTTLCVAGGYYGGYGFATTAANVTSSKPLGWNGDPVAPAKGPYGASMITAQSCVRATHSVCLASGENGSLATYAGPVPFLKAGFTATADGLSVAATPNTCASTAPSTPPKPGTATASGCLLDVTLPTDSTPASTASVTFAPTATSPYTGTLTCAWSVSPSADSGLTKSALCVANPSTGDPETGTPTPFSFPAGTYTISLAAKATYPYESANPVNPNPVTLFAKLIVNPPPGDCPLSSTGKPETPVLSIVSGSPQAATVDTAFGAPLEVEAECKDGTTLTPLPNATITWTAPGSGASGTITTPASPCPSTTPTSTVACTLTNSSGDASITVTANSTVGKWTLPATWDGQSVPFLLANTPPRCSTATGNTLVIMASGLDQTAASGSTFGAPLRLGLGCIAPGATKLQGTYSSTGTQLAPPAAPIIGATVTWSTGATSPATGPSYSDPNLGVTSIGSVSATSSVTATVTLPSDVTGLDPGATFNVTYNENVSTTAPRCRNYEMIGFGSDQPAPGSSQTAVSIGSAFAFPLTLDATCLPGASSPSTYPDASGNGNTATVEGGTGAVVPSASGPLGGSAITGNGTTGWLETANQITNPQVFTQLAWFKTTTSGSIISFSGHHGTAGGAPYAWDRMIYVSAGGHVVAGVYPGSEQVIVSPNTYNNGAWHMAAVTLSPAGFFLYVDGSLVASNTSVTSTQAYNGYWHIGWSIAHRYTWPHAPSTDYWPGSLAGVSVLPTALSASQIHALYNSSNFAAYSSNVLALSPSSYWPLQEIATPPTSAFTFATPTSGPSGTFVATEKNTYTPSAPVGTVSHYSVSFTRFSGGTWDGAVGGGSFTGYGKTSTPDLGTLPYVYERVAQGPTIPIL